MNIDPRNRTTAELKLTFDNMLQTLDSLKENIALHEQILTERYGAAMKLALEAAGKTSGELTQEIDGVKLEFSLKPKVKWDNLKLRDVAEVSWEAAEERYVGRFNGNT
mgnify:CR=1 FL=1